MAHEIWIGLQEFQDEVHRHSLTHGFWDHDDKTHQVDAEKFALMHSEISEALSSLRDGDMEHVGIELMDCVWRIGDYMAHRGLHMNHYNNLVREKNSKRPMLHGRKW
jgi:hypothetical protein